MNPWSQLKPLRLSTAMVLVFAVSIAQAPAQMAGDAKPKVLVRFTWKLKGEYAPLFVALDKGYYAAEGLDIVLAEGSGAETVVKMIGVATDKIAYGPATVVPEAVEKGLPVQVVAVYQPEVPIALVSFPEIPLKTPKDLEGRTLGTLDWRDLRQPSAGICQDQQVRPVEGQHRSDEQLRSRLAIHGA